MTTKTNVPSQPATPGFGTDALANLANRLDLVERFVARSITTRERERLVDIEGALIDVQTQVQALRQQVAILSRATANPIPPYNPLNGTGDF